MEELGERGRGFNFFVVGDDEEEEEEADGDVGLLTGVVIIFGDSRLGVLAGDVDDWLAVEVANEV